MKYRRNIISFFLLFAYSMGFATHLIPHCSGENVHFSSGVIEAHHHHEHHNNEITNADHSGRQVKHQEHYDAGIYDLIVCFLSDLEHPPRVCTIKHYVSSNNQGDFARSGFFLASVIERNVTTTKESNKEFFEGLHLIYHSPDLNNILLRGPPQLSC